MQMKLKHFLYFILGYGVLLLFGTLIMFGSFNDSDYYREQTYNNLQQLKEPEPIQHYKEAVDNTNQQTEIGNLNEQQTPINDSFTSMFKGTIFVNKEGNFSIWFWIIAVFLLWLPWNIMWR